jgi:hypothetical protein
MPVKNNARKKRIVAQNAKLQLKKTNPEKFKLLQEKENIAHERRNKRDEDEKAILNSQLEKEQLLKKEEQLLKEAESKRMEIEKKNDHLIKMWEFARITQISNGGFLANFRIGNVSNEHSLILTIFQEVEVVTIDMMNILWIIFYNGNAYISSSSETTGSNTSVLEQYKDCKHYSVIFEGCSQEIGPICPEKGEIVYGKRIGQKFNFSDTDVPHLGLPGSVIKKLIKTGFVIPYFCC